MSEREPAHDSGRNEGVLRFRHRRSDELKSTLPESGDDLAKFAHGEESEAEYRHRMLTNLAGLVVIVLLIGAGWWLADKMAEMRRNQDCVLSGRRGCTPVEVNRDRW